MPLSCYFVCQFCWCAAGTPTMFIVSGLYSSITGRLELSWRRLSSLAAFEFVVSTALRLAGHGKAGVVAMFYYRCGTFCPCLNICTVLDLTCLTIICALICWYLMCMERWDDIYYGNSCHSSDFVVTCVTAGCHNDGLWSPRRRTSLALYALRLLLSYIVGYDWDGFFISLIGFRCRWI